MAQVRVKVPSWAIVCFALLALAGTAGFLTGVNSSNPLRTWQAYLVNFLFWTGLSFGQVCFVAVLNMTGARWGRPLKRLAEALGAYLPVGFLLFWVLYFGKEYLFPWIHQPVPEKQAWLNAPFLFLRDGAGILLLSLVSVAMIYFSIKADRQWSAAEDHETLHSEGLKPWEKSWQMQKILSPIIGVVYAFVLSLMGFDLVMSLDPHWYSTLLGGYFFVGCFYTGIAALCLLSLLVAGSEGLKSHITPRHFHDLGKLLFAFCLFTGYLFYAQFLVIWYGNVPEETRYVILRVKLTPWEPLAWVVLFMIFLVPFFVLLSKKIKLRRLPMVFLSVIIMAGMWCEKLILIAPSIWTEDAVPLGATEVLVTAGFLGIVGLCATLFLRMVPAFPVSDPLFRQSIETPKEGLSS
jgi:hypothetical protein